MNKQHLLSSGLLATFLLYSGTILSATCNFLDPSPQPAWVNEEQAISGYYTGVGVSGKSRKGSDYQIQKSAQDAKRDLAENIQVTIQSSLTVLQNSSSNNQGESISSEQAESLINTTANASLKNVITDEVWLDQNSCLVWTRVKVKKSIVELEASKQKELIKLKQLEQELKEINVDSSQVNLELNKLALVKNQYNNINFTLINELAKQSNIQLQIQQLNTALKGNVETKASADELFLKARDQILLASSDSNDKKQHLTKAINFFKTLIKQNPFNEDSHDWSEKALFELILLELKRKNPCASKFHIEKIINLSDSNSWVLKAKKMRRKARCNAKARQTFNFKNTFDAKSVGVSCNVTLDTTKPWDNVCKKIVSHFNSQGALAQHIKGTTASNFDFIIHIMGSGEIIKRITSEKTEYQFKADISTKVSHKEGTFVEEEYSGIGGWNPISQKMAVDVIGIHVFKRFIKLINLELEG